MTCSACHSTVANSGILPKKAWWSDRCWLFWHFSERWVLRLQEICSWPYQTLLQGGEAQLKLPHPPPTLDFNNFFGLFFMFFLRQMSFVVRCPLSVFLTLTLYSMLSVVTILCAVLQAVMNKHTTELPDFESKGSQRWTAAKWIYHCKILWFTGIEITFLIMLLSTWYTMLDTYSINPQSLFFF